MGLGTSLPVQWSRAECDVTPRGVTSRCGIIPVLYSRLFPCLRDQAALCVDSGQSWSGQRPDLSPRGDKSSSDTETRQRPESQESVKLTNPAQVRTARARILRLNAGPAKVGKSGCRQDRWRCRNWNRVLEDPVPVTAQDHCPWSRLLHVSGLFC